MSTYLHYSIFKRHVFAISSFSLSKWTKARVRRPLKAETERWTTGKKLDDNEKRGVQRVKKRERERNEPKNTRYNEPTATHN